MVHPRHFTRLDFQQFNEDDELKAFQKTSGTRAPQVVPREVKKPTEQVYLANEFIENAHKKRAQNGLVFAERGVSGGLKGKGWHSRQDSNL